MARRRIPSLAGAVAGLAAGGVAATLYAAHCTDDSPLFVATWYTLAIAALAAARRACRPRFRALVAQSTYGRALAPLGLATPYIPSRNSPELQVPTPPRRKAYAMRHVVHPDAARLMLPWAGMTML